MKALRPKAFLVGTIDFELGCLVSPWYALGPRVEGMIWGCMRSLMGILNTLWYRHVQPATHSISGQLQTGPNTVVDDIISQCQKVGTPLLDTSVFIGELWILWSFACLEAELVVLELWD